MGAKSTNVITTKHMLPLFQVISDLEKPYDSNTSLQTLPSSFYCENNSFLSESQDIVIHHHEKSENLSSGDFFSRGNITDEDGNHFVENIGQLVSKREDRRRDKKRRRLKGDDGGMKYDYTGRKYRGHIHKDMDIYYKSSRHHTVKSKDITEHPHSSTPRDHRVTKKKTGLFTTMGLNMYQDDGVDLSRHFKDLANEDLVSDDGDHAAVAEHSDCPTYEVPKDIIRDDDSKKRRKKGHRRCLTDVDSENADDVAIRRRHSTGQKKMNSKEIIKKYEDMLTVLIEKCQEKDSLIHDKDKYITKMKAKLKQLLEYNSHLGEEIDYTKRQHGDMMAYLEQQKQSAATPVREVQPARSEGDPICSSCATNEVVAVRCQRENARLNEDIVMLKNVVYRLNVQLSRYQDKLRNSLPRTLDTNLLNITNSPLPKQNPTISGTDRVITGSPATDGNHETETQAGVSIPPLPVFTNNTANTDLNNDNNTEDRAQQLLAEQMRANFVQQEEVSQPSQYDGRLVWGDVNTHTLAPLLNAYQQSLAEKDDLIRDYEREFNRFAGKLREVITENANMHDASQRLATEATSLRSACGLASTERDQLRRDCRELTEKVEQLEAKLKDVHECYEQKVESMSRDYTLVHREYSQAKEGLAGALGRCQALQERCRGMQAEPSVPAAVHNVRVDECKRLLDELKQRYELDKNRLTMRLGILQESNTQMEKRLLEVSTDRHTLEAKVKHADRVIRRWRREIATLRSELVGTRASRDAARRRATRATALCRQVAAELQKAHGSQRLQHARAEKIIVQKEALKELDAVEDRMKEQDRNLETIKEQSGMEISRLEDLLREKEATIEAMRRHINGDRLQRYAGHKLPSHKLPEDLMKAKAAVKPPEIRKEPPPKPVRADLPSTSKGHYAQKDKGKGPARDKDQAH